MVFDGTELQTGLEPLGIKVDGEVWYHLTWTLKNIQGWVNIEDIVYVQGVAK